MVGVAGPSKLSEDRRSAEQSPKPQNANQEERRVGLQRPQGFRAAPGTRPRSGCKNYQGRLVLFRRCDASHLLLELPDLELLLLDDLLALLLG